MKNDLCSTVNAREQENEFDRIALSTSCKKKSFVKRRPLHERLSITNEWDSINTAVTSGKICSVIFMHNEY